MSRWLTLATAATITASVATSVTAQAPRLGTITFPTSGAPAARPHFIRGVLYLHSFEYQAAIDAFREAQRMDPAFAMAYWGEALSYTHPVWNQQDEAAARAALARLAPTREARRARTPTERERGYLDAVEMLYGAGSKPARDTAYAKAMERLAGTYPDDLEAQSFYALALLGLSQGDRDIPTYMRAGAIAQEVRRKNPDHPGAAHYVIHSFDDPVHAPLGLAAARAYGDIAPGAAHAQHMTSHIFLAMGMWDDVIAANLNASTMDSVMPATGKRRWPCGHYAIWLGYGYQQEGRMREAAQLITECEAVAAARALRSAPTSVVTQDAAYRVDTGDWTAPPPAVDTTLLSGFARMVRDFTAAYSALQAGRTADADSALASLAGRTEGPLPFRDIMVHELRGASAAARGDADGAVAHLRRAIAIEDTLPIEFGPPAVPKPPRELLGEMLAGVGRHADAVVAFKDALRRTPGRSLALLGLARAATRADDRETAAEAYATLAANWKQADPGVAGVAEARRASP